MTDEARNPFGGFVFSGADDVLARLSEAARSEGVPLVPVDLGDGAVWLCLPARHVSESAARALIIRLQAGEFGDVSLGLFGGEVRPPH